MDDVTLLFILVLLAFVAAILRMLLAKKKGTPNSVFWTVQEFVFPVLLLIALVLWINGRDLVFGLVMLGLLEEILCIFLRRDAQKKKHE